MFCRRCGSKIAEDSAFCSKCGHKVLSKMSSYRNAVSNVEYETDNLGLGLNKRIVQHRAITNPNYQIVTGIENVATEVVKKNSFQRSLIVILGVIALLISCASLYAVYFVRGPENTVERAVSALCTNDVNSLAECFSPQIVAEYEGTLGVADTVLGVLGVGTDTKKILGLSPLLSEVTGNNHDYSCKVICVDYSGEVYELFPIKFDGMAKLLASDAAVTVEEYENGEYGRTDIVYLKNYGKSGWLIEDGFLD